LYRILSLRQCTRGHSALLITLVSCHNGKAWDHIYFCGPQRLSYAQLDIKEVGSWLCRRSPEAYKCGFPPADTSKHRTFFLRYEILMNIPESLQRILLRQANLASPCHSKKDRPNTWHWQYHYSSAVRMSPPCDLVEVNGPWVVW